MKKRILCVLAVLLLLIPVIPVAAAEPSKLELDNSNYNYTFDDIDGGSISTQSEGKPKLIVFFGINCGHCMFTLGDIASSDWINSDEVDVCAIAVPNYPGQQISIDNVKDFRDAYYAGSPIPSGKSSDTREAYRYYQVLGTGSNTFGTPLIAMIDADNKLQYVTTGRITADTIKNNYLPNLAPAADPAPGPDTPQQPDTPDTPSEGNKPGKPETPSNPSGEEPEKPGDNSEVQGSSKTETACNHVVGESVLVNAATATGDALAAYKCAKCGITLKYEAVPNSAFATFLKEAENSILNAQQGEVVINTKIWTSFNRAVFEAMKNRPDVAVTVNYVYEGNPYVLKIPAGTDVSLLMDENGFGGFRYIDAVLSAKN